MSHFNVFREQVARLHGFDADYAIVDLPPAKEDEEDWSDLRWAMEHLPHTLESERILQALVIAENAADEYIDKHGPALNRPAPDWEDWEDGDQMR